MVISMKQRCSEVIRASWMLLVIMGLLGNSHGATVLDVIESEPSLGKMEYYMEEAHIDLRDKLGEPSGLFKYTVFAPRDEAFLNVPANIQRLFTPTSLRRYSTGVQLEKMFSNHISATTGSALSRADFRDRVLNALEGQKLYMREINGEFYVNGARIIGDGLFADNGVVYIIDTFLYEVGDTRSAWSYMQDELLNAALIENRATKFTELLNAYKNNVNQPVAYYLLNGVLTKYVTVFVPSDKYLNKLNTEFVKLTQESQAGQLKKVIESHIITNLDGTGDENRWNNPGSVYHSDLLVRETRNEGFIQGLEGAVLAKRVANNVVVSNNCAQGLVVKANITLSNGVMHIIDGMLGFLYYDAVGMIEAEEDLRDFEAFMRRSPSELQDLLTASTSTAVAVPESQKYTVFAPNHAAFSMLDRDISQQRETVENVMKMLMMRGTMHSADMTNGTTRETLKGDIQAVFSQYEDNFYVEVDHVKARVVRSDLCVRNGIIHIVDRVLGVVSRNLWEEIYANDDLVQAANLIMRGGMEVRMRTGNDLTFFAPTNRAFSEMVTTSVGRQFTSNDALAAELVKRHTIERIVYLDQLYTPNTLKTGQNGKEIEIVRSGSEYFVQYGDNVRIRVIVKDIKVKNGVLNIIDGVIFQDTKSDLALTSSAPAHSSTIYLLTLSILICLHKSIR